MSLGRLELCSDGGGWLGADAGERARRQRSDMSLGRLELCSDGGGWLGADAGETSRRHVSLLASGREWLLRIVSMLTRLVQREKEPGTGTGTGTGTTEP